MDQTLITWIVGIAGGIGTVGTLIVSGIRGKRADEIAAREFAAKQLSDNDKAKLDLNNRIDERIQNQLEEAWSEITELKSQVKSLMEAVAKKGLENQTILQAVKHWFTNLVHWDRLGRHGRMPLPSQADLDLLQLDPNEPTLTAEQIMQARKDAKAAQDLEESNS